MLPTDLCTLADLKIWLGETSTERTDLLDRLISGASADIYAYLNRSYLFNKSYTEVFNKIGNTNRQMLSNYPVVSISSVSINGTPLAAAPLPGPNSYPTSGYLLSAIWDGFPPGQPQSVYFMAGGIAPICQQSVVITYNAGYVVTNEMQSVPAAPGNPSGVYKVNVTAPYGPWAADIGVTYANGTPLTKVVSAPIAGQYALDAIAGGYIFAAADQAAAILISYSFIPSAINQACVEIAAERFRYRTRIGESSVTTQGMRTASFRNEAMSPYVKSLLQSYIKTVPF